MPLSHDLRPAAVLEKTMLYLLRNIADTGNDHNWEEWFDFLWSRTRGIRKVRGNRIHARQTWNEMELSHYLLLYDQTICTRLCCPTLIRDISYTCDMIYVKELVRQYIKILFAQYFFNSLPKDIAYTIILLTYDSDIRLKIISFRFLKNMNFRESAFYEEADAHFVSIFIVSFVSICMCVKQHTLDCRNNPMVTL